MRALVLEDYWDLRVQELPDPELGDGDVLLEVVATGICGSDLHGFTGENGRRHPGQVMGHETVARVRRLGPGVPDDSTLSPGDVVTVNPVIACGVCERCRAGREQSCADRLVIGVAPERTASFAELLVAPWTNVVRMPPSMPVEYGALVEPLAVGYHAARRGGCAAGDRVLVIGGGPIGQACVLAARRLGAAAVVVSEPAGHRRRLSAELGAHPVDPSEDDVAAATESLLGGRPDLVIDAVGTSTTLATALTAAPLGATVVLVGMAAPEVAVAAFDITTMERSVVGSFTYSAAEFRQTAEWVGTAPAELAALVEGRVDLDGAPAAFTALARGEDSASKVLVFSSSDGLPPA